MITTTPVIEQFVQETLVHHVARCARICYASNKTNNDDALFERLRKDGHYSMFRHATKYFMIPKCEYTKHRKLSSFINKYIKSPYVNFAFDGETKTYYISFNYQFYFENINKKEIEALLDYEVDASVLKENRWGKEIVRYTYCIDGTQISTSRELNRTSPNNIAEQSTRYCNFSNDKFGHNVRYALPHWYEDASWYLKAFTKFAMKLDEWFYFIALKLGLKPQDAREFLFLMTSTKVVYTYTLAEWRHIIDLRYYGTTGAPHPNAKLAIGLIYQDMVNKDII